MSNRQLSNFDFTRLLEPWFPLLGRVHAAALRDHLAGIPLLGMPKKTERANDIHRAVRTNLRRVCDLAEPLMSLTEEPDGQGLDYLTCRMDQDRPFRIRWGHYKGGSIRRNRTERTRQQQEQGYFEFSDKQAEDEAEGTPWVTVGHTIEDDYVEIGAACWWIGRLVLLRERPMECEVITEVHCFEPPIREVDRASEVPPPLVEAREQETREWEQMIQGIAGA